MILKLFPKFSHNDYTKKESRRKFSIKASIKFEFSVERSSHSLEMF
jgi:hypothetical protein